MGLLIRSLLIVMIVKSQGAYTGNQKTVCCELDTSSKIDELNNIVSNYLDMVYTELRNTKHQVEELKETVSSELRDTRRKVDELQVEVSGIQETVSSELGDTRRKVDELQDAVSGNQETVSSELQDTRRKVDELQVAVSGNQETVTSELRNTTHYLRGTQRQVEDLQQAVSSNQETVFSELEYTRRNMDKLQVVVSEHQETVSSELEDAIRKIDDLQVAVSDNQETVSSELGDTRRKVDELQAAVSENQEFVTSEQRNTLDHLTDTNRQMGAMGRQVGELKESVSALKNLLNGNLLFQWKPKDCSDILAKGVGKSGVYTIKPLDSGEPFRVYCDMETDGGGWTVFQRRQDGSVDFYLDFASYSRGFGSLEGEFWLGNDNLHRLTAQGEYKLRVDLSDFETDSRYAVYDSFSVADVSDNYRLTLRSYSGTAGDSLSWHKNYQFSTKDRDNDGDVVNCAQIYHGAWWYGPGCHHCNLNGLYLRGTTTEHGRGVVWYHWKGHLYTLKTSEMKIRPTRQ